MDELVN